MTGNSKALEAFLAIQEFVPRLKRWSGRRVLVKFGGAAIAKGALADQSGVITLPGLLVLWQMAGAEPVLVHGGGPEISACMRRFGKEPVFVDGRRVTDEESLAIVEMVLAGRLNKALVGAIQGVGGRAVGICGKDGGTLLARRLKHKSASGDYVDLGFVGEVEAVDPHLIETLVGEGFIPVIASLATEEDGQTLNVNADTAAAAIAGSMGADLFVLLTDVPGIMTDPSKQSSLVPQLSVGDVHRMISQGIITGGMIPKVEAAVSALSAGVKQVAIIDGRDLGSLLNYILGEERNAGTVITG